MLTQQKITILVLKIYVHRLNIHVFGSSKLPNCLLNYSHHENTWFYVPSLTTTGWNPRIEGLRGFAILLVFASHLGKNEYHLWGSLGVSIFFVVSGYVITGSMSRQLVLTPLNQLDILTFLKRFYVRRARRLLPLASLVILVTLAISLLDPTADRKQYLLSSIFCALYVGNFFGFTFGYTDLAPALGHFWSLAVEEQFYFVWPIVFFISFKVRRHIVKFIYWLILGIVLIQFSHPLIAFAGKSVWTLPTTYFDLLLLGCILNLANQKIENVQGNRLFFLKLAGFLSLIYILFGLRFSITSPVSNFQYNLNFLLSGVLFVYALRANLFDNFILKFFGKISYSLYCIHWPLIVFSRNFLGGGLFIMICVAVISIILSMVSHKYFESKFYKPVSSIL